MATPGSPSGVIGGSIGPEEADSPASGPSRGGVEPGFGGRRLSAHNYFGPAPELPGGPVNGCRHVAAACPHRLSDERRLDDSQVGTLGFGAAGDLAVTVAALHVERVGASPPLRARGLGSCSMIGISSGINRVVNRGDGVAPPPPWRGIPEDALCAAGRDFDIEVSSGAPDLPDPRGLLARARTAPAPDATPGEARRSAPFDGSTAGASHLL